MVDAIRGTTIPRGGTRTTVSALGVAAGTPVRTADEATSPCMLPRHEAAGASALRQARDSVRGTDGPMKKIFGSLRRLDPSE